SLARSDGFLLEFSQCGCHFVGAHRRIIVFYNVTNGGGKGVDIEFGILLGDTLPVGNTQAVTQTLVLCLRGSQSEWCGGQERCQGGGREQSFHAESYDRV